MDNTNIDSINFEDMVRQLCKSGDQIVLHLTSDQAHVLHMGVGIAGEAGELLDAIKKWTIYQKALDHDNIVEELGDLEFYMEGLRQRLNITRAETLDFNIEKLGKRYKQHQYSDQQAHDRADKQEQQS